ncbi:MAG: 30S ribosomal protein S17 [Chlamydiae bacterium SM23_39]|nr:MAG: 30S ribosomal protein S17 [Chlamydiae bacterium SM23_39]
MKRNKRKVLQGIVLSNKMNKTVVVSVSRKFRHPKYEKLIEKRKKYYAHSENKNLEIGSIIKIMECRPISKIKRWRVIEG